MEQVGKSSYDLALAVPHKDVRIVGDDVGFFQRALVRDAIAKNTEQQEERTWTLPQDRYYQGPIARWLVLKLINVIGVSYS